LHPSNEPCVLLCEQLGPPQDAAPISRAAAIARRLPCISAIVAALLF